MKRFLSFATLSIAANVLAAPFCVVTQFGTECWYYDMPSCRQAAASKNGACIINQDEAQPAQQGGTPFCVVTQYATNCWYYNAQSCQQAAASNRGACVVNPNR
jgi:outer membrane protein assembly factor BamE (lipoprotein component of BamABCDE complex)